MRRSLSVKNKKLEFLNFWHVFQKCEKEKKDKEQIEWEIRLISV